MNYISLKASHLGLSAKTMDEKLLHVFFKGNIKRCEQTN
jgi:hypothetical protein